MNETSTIRALLALEDSSADMLFKRAPDSEAYLWPLTRWPIASALASAHLNVTPHIRAHRRLSPFSYLKLVAREVLPSPKSADRIKAPIEHLFMVSGVTRVSEPRGAGNWLSDAFAQSLGTRAAVIQESEFDLLTPRVDRPTYPRTWTRAPVATRVGRAARANPPSADAREQVLRFLSDIYARLEDMLPKQLHDGITQEVLGRVARLRYVDAEFNDLLDRARPKRIYMEDASYGHYSSLIRIAHKRGIEVAELQHGWIGPSHAAYNYSRAWFDSPLTSSLPDTLLTFGDYWGEQLRFPGRLAAVGKPHLEQAAKSALPYPKRQHRVLVVSSVYELERLTEATLLLRRLLPDSWEVALRPHPTERADAESLFAEALVNGVTIDNELDVNVSVASSRAVVGLVSTVLFEALPLGVHIGVIESDLAAFYADAKVFPRRLDTQNSYADFIRTLTSGHSPNMETAGSIWQPESVSTFLEECASS